MSRSFGRRLRSALVLALALVFGLGPAWTALASDWRQFGFNAAHTSNNPLETILGPSTVSSLTRSFSFGTSDAPGQPIVVNGRAFFVAGPVVYAIDATTGSLIWSRNACETSACGSGTPAFSGGAVWIPTYTGRLEAFKASTGRLVFDGSLSGVVQTPSMAGKTVFATDSAGDIEAVDSGTRQVLWLRTAGTVLAAGDFSFTPAVKNGVVYLNTTQGNVFALDAATGERLYGPISVGTASSFPVVVKGGKLFVNYLSSPHLGVVALDASDGSKLWTSPDLLTTAFTPLAVANGLVFGSLEEPVGGLWALHQRDGTFSWQFGGPEGPSDLTVANGVIYRVDIEGRLIAADASDGVPIAFFGTTGTEEFNDIGPVVVNGSVYLSALIPCGGSYCWALERWSV